MYCVIFRLLHKCLCACPCVAWLIGWVNCSIIAGRFVLKCSMNSKLVRLQTCSESSTVKRNQVCTNSPILHTRAILLLLCILVLPAQSPVFKFCVSECRGFRVLTTLVLPLSIHLPGRPQSNVSTNVFCAILFTSHNNVLSALLFALQIVTWLLVATTTRGRLVQSIPTVALQFLWSCLKRFQLCSRKVLCIILLLVWLLLCCYCSVWKFIMLLYPFTRVTLVI